ncbi:MFS transporter, SP family [Trichuris suis]|nr:MFS transporter, SP family [Trichuris suis]
MVQVSIDSTVSSFGQLDLRPTKITGKVIVLTLMAVMSGFLFGYDTGVVSGAMLIMKVVFDLDDIWQEIIVSVTVGAAAIFALFGGWFNDRFGRKKIILLSCVLFIVGSVILGAAESREVLVVGRIIVGAAIGISSSTIPAYIAETSPPHIRGRMIVMFQLLITFGLWVAGLLDAAFSYIQDDNVNWRLMLGVAAIPALIQLIGFLFMPESPRWLANNGRTEEAFDIFTSIYGNDETGVKLAKADLDIIKEIQDQRLKEKEAKGEKNVFLEMLKHRETRKALVIGCLLMVFQQLSGINTVMYYSATIVQLGGVRSRTLAIWMAAVTSGFNFFCTFIGIYLVERAGRRLVLIGSTIGVILSLVLLGIGFALIASNSPGAQYDEALFMNGQFSELAMKDSCRGLGCDACSYLAHCGFCYELNGDPTQTGSCVSIYSNHSHEESSQYSLYGRCLRKDFDKPIVGEDVELLDPNVVFDYGYCITSYSWIPILGMTLYLCCFSVGLGGVPWTINAEIFPNWARSHGVSITTFVNWFFNLIVSLTFLSLVRAITRHGAFFFYAVVSAIGLAIFYLIVPETKGVHIEDIELIMKGSWRYNAKQARKLLKSRAQVHPVDVVINSVGEEMEKTTRF